MLDVKIGQKLKAKETIYCLGGTQLEKGEIMLLSNLVELESGLVRLILKANGNLKGVDISPKDICHFFCKYSENSTEPEMSLEEVQVAYNSVVMTENGYMPKNVQNQFKGTWMQEGKSGSDKEIDTLIEALEAFNEENYKESAINIALDEKDERKFMELTED